VIIYLAPTLLVLCLLAAATRLRHHIEPACPACTGRSWRQEAGLLACMSCGWSTHPQVAESQEKQAA
jgi:hypothetical protein